ncbi:hypothetical protein BH10PSE4_BH10PSE4_08610 [soil metagenome]
MRSFGNTDFQALRLAPGDLSIMPEFARFLDADGVLRTPPGHVGFVLYGPYMTLEAGVYQITLDLDAGEGAVFDVFADGTVFLERAATAGTVSLQVVGPVKGLEFRLSVRGGPLIFRDLTLTKVAPDAGATAAGSPTIISQPLVMREIQTRALSRLWKSLHGRSREAVVQMSPVAQDADLLAWSEQLPRARVIEAWDEASLLASASTLESLGIDIAALRDCRQDNFASEAQFAERAGRLRLASLLREHATFPEADFVSPFLAALAQGHGAVQFTGLAEGVAICPCPFTGAILASERAVPVACDAAKQSHIFHYFDGGTPFYLVVTGFGGRKAYIYVPGLELILQIGKPQFDWGSHQPAIDLLRRFAMQSAIAFFDYLEAPTTPTILAGTVNNLGHYFWNDLAGLARYGATGLPQATRRVLAYRYAFLGPELGLEDASNLEVLKSDDAESLFRLVLEQHLYCVRPTALRMHPETGARIRQHVEGRLSPEHRTRIAQAREAELLVWFNLRNHNKMWLDQVDAAVRLAERAALEGRSLALFLDGMIDCEPLAAEIRRRAPGVTRLINGFDLPLHESISWAYACDAYVATIGSGLTITTWVAGRPGVAHSEQAHMNQMEFWSEVRPDVPAPTVPERDAIVDRGHGAYCNYNLDPETIVSLLWSRLSTPTADDTDRFRA